MMKTQPTPGPVKIAQGPGKGLKIYQKWEIKNRQTCVKIIAELQYVLVFQCCHNKVPQTRWLRQQKFTVSQFWRLIMSQFLKLENYRKGAETSGCQGLRRG